MSSSVRNKAFSVICGIACLGMSAVAQAWDYDDDPVVPGSTVDHALRTNGDSIVRTSGSTTVFEHRRVQLVAPTGNNYRWKKNGVPLGSVAPPNVLTLDPVLASDAGIYTVTYNDEARAETETITFALSVAHTGLLSASSGPSFVMAFGLMTVLGTLAAAGGWIAIRRKGAL